MFWSVNGADRNSTSTARRIAGPLCGALALGALLATHAPAHESALKTGTRAETASASAEAADVALPPLLSQTGLYRTGSTREIALDNWPYSPAYPLWSDGATKRRWLHLPAGTHIDAHDPEDWQFPIGTRIWKEFSFDGERVETRYIERRADGSYRYATYVWDRALGDARLAPSAGVTAVHELAPGVAHDAPSETDCRACHEGRRTPVLGFRALQLSDSRDPLAPHAEPPPAGAVTLGELIRTGVLDGLPQNWRDPAPRIAAPSPVARATAGYLLGNCAHCHNGAGPLASLGLNLDPPITPEGYSAWRAGLVGRTSHYRLPGVERSLRVTPGKPEASALWFRAQSRFPAAQMPPLGTKLVDHAAVDLIARFIAQP